MEKLYQAYQTIYQQVCELNESTRLDQLNYEKKAAAQQQQRAQAQRELDHFRSTHDYIRKELESILRQHPLSRLLQPQTASPCEPNDSMLAELRAKVAQAGNARPEDKARYAKKIHELCEGALLWISQEDARLAGKLASFGKSGALELNKQYVGYLQSEQVRGFFQLAYKWMNSRPKDRSSELARLWGFQAFPLPVQEDYQRYLPTGCPGVFDMSDGGTVYLPQWIPGFAYFECSTRAVANQAMDLLLRCVQNTMRPPYHPWQVMVLDTITLYDDSLGFLQAVSGDNTTAYASPACHTVDDANEILEHLWSMCHVPDPVPRTLIIRGYLSELEGTLIQRLVNNAEALNLRIYIINESNETQPPRYITAAGFEMYHQQATRLIHQNGCAFMPMTFRLELGKGTIEEIRKAMAQPEGKVDYRYFAHQNRDGQWHYTLGNKDMRLIYGEDDDGTPCEYNTRDNMKAKGADGNAGFVVGVSGSGKSTLIHMLIASAVLNYHPDDVELWLADFKMKEFARYIKHCPPHVRYILLDESADMVRSLIDKLTAEMKRRQQLLARYGKQFYQEVPGLPLLFVIIDEFSRMSQAVREDQEYRIKLQNLFTQARDQGIRFLLSSQFYANGIEALSDQAKDQIGIRLAMRTNDKNEMKATLAMPLRLTDEQDRMIRTLPKFKVLAREGTELRKINVYYFNSDDSVKYDEMIDSIQRGMIPARTETELAQLRAKDPAHAAKYFLDKKPISITGDATLLDRFDERTQDFLRDIKNDRFAHPGENRLLMWLGRPRRLEASSAIKLLRQDDENIVCCADYQSDDEQRSGMISVVLSMLLSARLQSFAAQIWMPEKDIRLAEAWQDQGADIVSDVDEILQRATVLEQDVASGTVKPQLIIMVDPIAMLGSQRRRELKKKLLSSSTAQASSQASALLSKGFGAMNPFGGASPFGAAPAQPETAAPKRKLDEIIPYLLAAGSEQGVHLVLVVPQINSLFGSSILPENNLDFLRHRLAFRMTEQDSKEINLQLASRRMLTGGLTNCFVYRDGRNVVVREPYKLP